MNTPPVELMSLSTTARRRMRTSKEEIIILESFYKKNPNPNQEQKEEIAKVVKMGAKNVHFWFQNRRAKDNKKRKLLRMRQQQNQQVLDNGNETEQQQANQQQFEIDIFHQPQPQQQQSNHDNHEFKLPPISTIMVPHLSHLTIPYYFHHSHFGIEECMLQMQEMHVSRF